MVQGLHSGGADDTVRREDSITMPDSKRRISARHAMTHHVMGDLLSHLLDRVPIVDGDEQLEYVPTEQRAQRK
ncbi:hypothetical protein A5712_07475 [Mycobacterium sp. E2327]|nr:hypothetical protein A5712_07475 [Mycobacterium sp. E2327]